MKAANRFTLTTNTEVVPEPSSRPSSPLKEQVAEVMANYFLELDGQPANNLYQMVLEQVEGPVLEAVMDYARGNQSRAAEMLGLNRGTLRKKLKQYDLL